MNKNRWYRWFGRHVRHAGLPCPVSIDGDTWQEKAVSKISVITPLGLKKHGSL